MKFKFSLLIVAATFSVVLFSCSGSKKNSSSVTGWDYNSSKNGGFEYFNDFSQARGPGLVFIEGGSFIMGQVDEDVMREWDNKPRRVTVPSFYIDETEVRNVDYREYLYWINRVFVDYPEVYRNALPDTLVWRRPLAYNEPLVENYLRHPAYSEYPVVGVNWIQANDFCNWRTDRVNEMILVKRGILEFDPNQQNGENFNTEAYLFGKYLGTDGKRPMKDLDPNQDYRRVRADDGILLPRYRLPTEAEWEYAALGLIGNTYAERVTHRRIYPWDGHVVRNANKSDRGRMMANFVRGDGDYMGIAGSLNDGGDITVPVNSYYPNDYGLYCMAGNVNEWVADVYRPLSFDDLDEFSPFRGNVFMTKELDEENNIVDPDEYGRIRYKEETAEQIQNRYNYRRADNINYKDGDEMSNIATGGNWAESESNTKSMYADGIGQLNSLISDQSHVYKGGGWRDRAYWLTPGARRYLEAKEARDDIGFRCAMTRVGNPATTKKDRK